jgi:very-short-patch-repair endonuclease
MTWVSSREVPAIRPTNPHAKRLRREATDVEQRLWLAVRDRRLGGFKFRRQATIGPFVVDFLCAEMRLVIELDGGQHGAVSDAGRTALLEGCGYRVIRFWNNNVLENFEGVLEGILAALNGAVGTSV